jgi:hypothetical protein
MIDRIRTNPRSMMEYSMRWLCLLFVVVIATTMLALPPMAAAAGERCFPETGFCISGPLRDYWERHGGLPVFGYPISPVFEDMVEGTWSGPAQWFERDRLEDHSADRQGVLAGRLGAWMLELQGRPWQDLPQIDGAADGCYYFAETRHSLCGAFLRAWRDGGGLARFGYPLTEPLEESLPLGDSIWTGMVQYFERRRMEEHQELAGTRYAISFGLLGRDIFGIAKALKCARADSPLRALAGERGYSCAGSLPRLRVPIAVQPFEGGAMIWVSHPAGKQATIYVVVRDQARAALVWQSYLDEWREGVPLPEHQAPPPERYAPERGFGLLWASNATVRAALGWATAPEQADRGDIEQFYVNSGPNHLTIIASPGSRRRYVLYEEPISPDRNDTAEVLGVE